MSEPSTAQSDKMHPAAAPVQAATDWSNCMTWNAFRPCQQGQAMRPEPNALGVPLDPHLEITSTTVSFIPSSGHERVKRS